MTLRHLKEALWFTAAFGAVAICVRLIAGLGATTGLSDAMPWGIWKILNVVASVGLATGGAALVGLVHVLKLKKLSSCKLKTT